MGLVDKNATSVFYLFYKSVFAILLDFLLILFSAHDLIS